MKIIFFGTPQFAANNLNALIDVGHEIVAIVCPPDSRKGRGKQLKPCEVKEVGQENDITILQPLKLKDEGFIEQAVELAQTPAMQDILALDKGLQGQFTKLEEISKAEKLVFSKQFEGNSQLMGEMLEDIRKQKIISRLID